MSLKEWIKWDYSDISDPNYRNELKANRELGIILFLVCIVDIICIILGVADVFKIDKKTELYILVGLTAFFAFSGFLFTFLTKGRQKYVKFALLFDLVLIVFLSNLFVPTYSVLFLALPPVCAARYADKKISIYTSVTTAVLLIITGFVGYYTNIEYDWNIIRGLVGKIDQLTYWDYTRPLLTYSITIKFLIFCIFAFMSVLSAVRTKQFTTEATETIVKEERINGELNLARELQEQMLPRQFPAFPSINNFEIYADMVPAKEIGGDMYDFFLIDDQHLGIVAADVSGKGVPASLFMGMTKILIKNMLVEEKNMEVAIAKVNDMLVADNPIDLFVTAWVGVVDLNNGQLTYINAGHNPPLLKHNGEIHYLKDKSGIALGYVSKRMYKQNILMLSPNDRLFVYTDGVTEATNINGQLYGEVRLKDYLLAHMDDKDDVVVKELLNELNKFQKDCEQFDDITMISFTFLQKMNRKNAKKEFVATVNNFSSVSEFIEETLDSFEVPLKVINQMNIAVEEIFTNIAKYGFAGQTNGKATIDITLADNTVTIRTFDNSPMFNPFNKKDPDISLGVEDRPIGGLGILMVKKLMDAVDYQYENNTNIITLVKKVG